MAIKGKRKPKSRPRSAGRRPAAPARPIASGARALPWYRTMRGQLTIIVVLLALVGGIMWWVADARTEAQELDSRQEELSSYSDAVRDLVASLQPTVPEMLGAPFNTANKEAIANLQESVKRWSEDIELAATTVQTLAPPEGLQSSSVVIQQSFMLYRSAILTYRLVPGEDNERRRQKLIERGNEQRDLAGQSLMAGLGMIDDARAKAEMDPAGIQSPSTMTPILPSPEPTPDDEGKGKKRERADRSDRSGGRGEKKNDDKKKRDG